MWQIRGRLGGPRRIQSSPKEPRAQRMPEGNQTLEARPASLRSVLNSLGSLRLPGSPWISCTLGQSLWSTASQGPLSLPSPPESITCLPGPAGIPLGPTALLLNSHGSSSLPGVPYDSLCLLASASQAMKEERKKARRLGLWPERGVGLRD